MSEFTIDVPDSLRVALETMARRLTHRVPLMRAISEDMHAAVMENFEQQGRPKWKSIERAGEILQLTGRLKRSIDSDSDNDSAVVGTNVIYANIHNQGGKTRPHVIRPRNKKALAFGGRVVKKVNHPGSDIPARPFLTMTDEDLDGVTQTINDYLYHGTGLDK